MTLTTCVEEATVQRAVAARRVDAALQAHIDQCVRCREVAAVTHALVDLAQHDEATLTVPDPHLVWWRAQLVERWRNELAASRSVERVEWTQAALGLVGALVLLVWQWPALWRALSGAPATTSGPGAPLVGFVVLGVGAVLLTLAATLLPDRANRSSTLR
jgi:hypothetical protein